MGANLNTTRFSSSQLTARSIAGVPACVLFGANYPVAGRRARGLDLPDGYQS
jgi:hypothetical protein